MLSSRFLGLTGKGSYCCSPDKPGMPCFLYLCACRTSFLFDFTNIPSIVNEAAIQTLLNNMDRCPKNFDMYYNPDMAEWIK